MALAAIYFLFKLHCQFSSVAHTFYDIRKLQPFQDRETVHQTYQLQVPSTQPPLKGTRHLIQLQHHIHWPLVWYSGHGTDRAPNGRLISTQQVLLFCSTRVHLIRTTLQIPSSRPTCVCENSLLFFLLSALHTVPSLTSLIGDRSNMA
ncbi:hypothetical protein DFH27DRAFT_13417 [Peziza echinospora]|nr:hypothetical protein DFH27DRAFT_13417 [Peziza echinospora]